LNIGCSFPVTVSLALLMVTVTKYEHNYIMMQTARESGH